MNLCECHECFHYFFMFYYFTVCCRIQYFTRVYLADSLRDLKHKLYSTSNTLWICSYCEDLAPSSLWLCHNISTTTIFLQHLSSAISFYFLWPKDRHKRDILPLVVGCITAWDSNRDKSKSIFATELYILLTPFI